MNNNITVKSLLFACLIAGVALSAAAQTPKKVLVVTTTLGFRHSSIPTAEKILAKLGTQSGAFTVDYVQQPAKQNVPEKPRTPRPEASDAAKQKHKDDLAKWEADYGDKAKAAEQEFQAAMKQVLTKLGPDSLKNYDAVIFANTTGDLPLPDKDAFLDWIKSGKAFIGMHSCSDTFHQWPAFLRMLGGEFAGHGAQVGVECLNQDPKHPSTAMLGASWPIKQEEIYLIKNYDAKDCHELLLLDKHPNKPEQAGRFPISWCKEYGQGKVFYTSLGHREDVWDDEWKEGNGKRANAPEVAKAYQQHILGGIKWAMGLEAGDGKPQAK
ncbi:MAG: ThuA domain-containing protein [Verrucomicrobia bacterium]|nr:ThuA domain-containing protein [Verrucomicrobiota bacterium]